MKIIHVLFMEESNVVLFYVCFKNKLRVIIRLTGKFYHRQDLVFFTMKKRVYVSVSVSVSAKRDLEISAY